VARRGRLERAGGVGGNAGTVEEDHAVAAEYLGHADPGFTLRVYAHLMPSSEDRARKAIDRAFGRTAPGASAPDMRQGGP
jgi:integrase